MVLLITSASVPSGSISNTSMAAMANQLQSYFSRSDEEKRMLVKQIIQTKAGIAQDYTNKTLTVTLHSFPAQRYNVAAQSIAQLLNQKETIFAGTDLTLIFKTQ